MTSALRTLVVMRHAKAEQVAASDFERPLAARGHDDATAAGAWLAGNGITPDHAIVSAAARTVSTYGDVCTGAGWSLDPEVSEPLYAADVDSALDLVRLVDDDAVTLVVVAHNPTVSYLAQLLDDGEGDVGASTAMVTGFPTSALAVFTFDGSWGDLGPGTARLTAFRAGRP